MQYGFRDGRQTTDTIIEVTTSPKKFKQTPYTSQKMVATVFWDEKCVHLIDFMEHVITITANVYCEALNKLRHEIQNRRLLHNKAYS